MHKLSIAAAFAALAINLPAQNSATATMYGTGCYSRARSYYESFTGTGTFDLGSATGTNSFQHLFAGNSYVVLPGNNIWHTPTGTNLGLGDDTEVTRPLPFTFPYPGGTTTQLVICSNGFISPGVTNGTSFTPTPVAFLAGAPRYCAYWHDLNPSSGGQVLFDVDAVNGVVYVTWLNVAVYPSGSTNTFQVAFFSTGIVEFRYQVLSGQATTTTNVLVGWTRGSPARDPGNRDISATMPFITDPTDALPLTLASSARPVLGTSINLVTNQIPTGTPAGALIFSFTRHDPGLPLASLGMPDCAQYVGLDVTRIFVVVGTTCSVPLALPASAIHAGTHMYCQSATFSTGLNALGVIASNGLDLRLDVL